MRRLGRTCRLRGSNLEEQRLGIEVVALLHHRHQYILHSMTAQTEHQRLFRIRCRRDRGLHHDTGLTQLIGEYRHKLILALHQQRRQLGVVVIPAPAFSQQFLLLKRRGCYQSASDGIHAQTSHTLHEGTHIVGIKHGVQTTHTDQVACQHTVLHRTHITQRGVQLILTTQQVDSCHGSEQFHRRGRAQGLLRTNTI